MHAHVPPTSSKARAPGSVAIKGSATWKICFASSRVGETMMAPTCAPQPAYGVQFLRVYTTNRAVSLFQVEAAGTPLQLPVVGHA